MTAEPHGATRMELVESIKTSWGAVEESGVPDHLQKLAFKVALRSLLGVAPHKAGLEDRRVPSTLRDQPDGGSGEGTDERRVVGEEEVMRLVSSETGVPAERLEQVLHIDEGVVKLIGQHTKFGSTTSAQARTIAQIVTVVRKLGMAASDTSFEVIKEACESKHCYDSSNFASLHMAKIDGFVVKGEKKSRRLEARGPGVAAFPGLIDKVLGTV